MSRAGYSDDLDNGRLNVWRGAVKSAIRGKRGQAFLQELAASMDAMPDKRLISNVGAADGCMCTLAVVAQARGLDMDKLNCLMEDDETEAIAKMLGIADAMGREIMFENDEGRGDSYFLAGGWNSPPPPAKVIEEKRWIAMRQWVAENLTESKP
jgi:hypothetical protein